MKDEGKLFTCECSSEILSVHYWEWDDGIPGDFEFAIFRNYTYKNNIWCRIKYACWHLWTGRKHLDQICLSKEKVAELAEFLTKYSSQESTIKKQ